MNQYKDIVVNICNEIKSDKVNKLFNYLDTTDFFDAPASTRFHHSYKHGLVDHCLEIYDFMIKLSVPMNGVDINREDAFLLAFGHDMAKINFYKTATKYTKVNGKWIEYEGFEMTEDPNSFTHEPDSIYRLVKLIPDVDIKIVQAINYHHGAFNEPNKNLFSSNCKINPYTLLLHTADMMSAISGDRKVDKLNKERGF